MQITFDPNNLTAYEREILGMIVNGIKPVPVNEPEAAPLAVEVKTITIAGAEFPAPEPVAETPKRGRGRPRKEEAAPQPEATLTAEQTAAVDETIDAAAKVDDAVKADATPKKLTIDDCRSALKFYTDQFGIQPGIEVLKEFGASRISELEEEQFKAFIEKCGVKV